jgi:hypothetical protein
MKMTIVVFWFITLCRFEDGCLHLQHLEDGESRYLRNVGNHVRNYTVSQYRILPTGLARTRKTFVEPKGSESHAREHTHI